MILSKKIRLELNNKQISLCHGHVGVARHAWNYGVQICKEALENKTKLPSSIDLHKLLVKDVKTKNPWYYNYSKCSPQQALRNLETAWKRCFNKIAKQPKFKKKGQHDSFYIEGNIRIKDNKIKLPKFGWVKLSEHLDELAIKNVTISRTANEWFVAFKYEKETTKLSKSKASVGVDLGIKTLATLSNGETISNIQSYKNAKKKLRKLQKSVSRKFVKGTKNQSSNYKKSVVKLSKAHQKVTNVRTDVLHKATTYLAKTFNIVVIEDLKISNMVKNHKLASAILDGGFYKFKQQLLYKKQLYGGSVIIANTFYASSKLCSCCGNKKEILGLSTRQYICEKCGIVLDRDMNASINLNNLAVSSTVSAFGDKSSTSFKLAQLVDELGMKHQMFTFV